MLYFRKLGFEVIITGKSPTGISCIRSAGYSDIILLGKKRDPIEQLADIKNSLSRPLNVRLVLARDFPSVNQALSFGKRCDCPVYYDSIEIWTGYFVKDGGKKRISFYKNWLSEKMKLGGITRVITHSRTAGIYLEKLYHLEPDKTGVLYSALPRERSDIPVMNLRSEINAGRNMKLIVCSGSLTAGRGLSELIDMFKYVGQNYNLIFIGDGPIKPILLDTVNKNGLQKRVCFFQFGPVDNYYDILSTADIGIDLRPSIHLNYDLNCSVRVVDYINCHLPVITSDTRGFKFIEKEYDILRCIPQRLPSQSQGEKLEQFAEEYQSKTGKIRETIDNALVQEFSFEANLARLEKWLSHDGVN